MTGWCVAIVCGFGWYLTHRQAEFWRRLYRAGLKERAILAEEVRRK